METLVTVLLVRFLVIAAVAVLVALLVVGVLVALHRRGRLDRARTAEAVRNGARWMDDGSGAPASMRRRVAGSALQGVAQRLDRDG